MDGGPLAFVDLPTAASIAAVAGLAFAAMLGWAIVPQNGHDPHARRAVVAGMACYGTAFAIACASGDLQPWTSPVVANGLLVGSLVALGIGLRRAIGLATRGTSSPYRATVGRPEVSPIAFSQATSRPTRPRSRSGMLLLCLLIVPCASAAEVSLRESVMHPLPLPDVAPMREVADQTYLDPAKAEYAYDLYLPGDGGKPPLVLMIHGGAPAVAGLRKAPLMRSWARQIAARSGAAVAAIGWDGDKRLTDQIDTAYAQLRARADKYGIDASRPCILTFSAGVASVLPHALGDSRISPRCMVGLYGDWEPAMRALPADARGLPVLVVRAGRDDVVPDTSAPAFVAAARKAGAKVEVLRHPEGLHVFEVRNPGETSARLVSQTLDFLRAHAGAHGSE